LTEFAPPRGVETKVREANHDQRLRPGTDRGPNRRKPANGAQSLSGRGQRLLAPPSCGSSADVGASGAAGAFVAELARAVADDLEGRLAEQISTALGARGATKLLDRRGLAEALNVSLPTLDRLRRDGCPELLLGDAPRFEIERVLEWLRAKGAK
jgi:hypothetical protein